jgi:hypothetical protein
MIGAHPPATAGDLDDHLVRADAVPQANWQADHAVEANHGGLDGWFFTHWHQY